MLKIRYILFLLCALTFSVSAWGVTSTVNGSTLYGDFDDDIHSVSWTSGTGAQKVTFTLSGTNKAIYAVLWNIYLASGPAKAIGGDNVGATFSLSWQVNADYDLEVTKVTIKVGKASGGESYITIGDGARSGNLFYTATNKTLSSGTKVYTTFESVPIVFEKALTWSVVTVDRIEITYNIIPKFIFKGTGAGGASEQVKWGNADNWLPGTLPSLSDDVFIRHDVVVSGTGEAKSVTIESTNKVTIAPTGTLKVGDGGIIGATEDNFKLEAAQAGTNKGQTGALLIDPACSTMPSATAEMYSKAYFDMNVDASERNNAGAYQYVGSPMAAGAAAKTVFPNSWVYGWEESVGEWKNKRKENLQPFVGYYTSQYAEPEGMLITYKGQLALNSNQELDLSYTATSAEPGMNAFANSYTAPIDITKFQSAVDFSTGVEATIYLFNTGSRNDSAARKDQGIDLAAAGQFIPIPVNSAADLVSSFGYPAVIPAMQGFYVKTNKAGKMWLNYERLVWNAAHGNVPLRAKRAEEQKNGALSIAIEADGWKDQVFLLESEEYDAAFENGYDAHKLMSGNLNIFTLEGEDALAVDATNRIAGTKIAVRTGAETAYTLTFCSVSGEAEWSLYDAETKETVDIEEGAQYTFFAEPNSEIRDRFYITERNDSPAVTTDLETVNNGAESHKFIKDGQLFVIKNGLIYNTLGVVVSR